jgi:hypothetical protein
VQLSVEVCASDWSRRWLCPGDRAPVSGHLVPPELLIDCAAHKKTAALVPQLQLQRDRCLGAALRLEEERDAALQVGEELRGELHRSAALLAARPTWLTTGALSGGVLFVGLLVGALLGGLAW